MEKSKVLMFRVSHSFLYRVARRTLISIIPPRMRKEFEERTAHRLADIFGGEVSRYEGSVHKFLTDFWSRVEHYSSQRFTEENHLTSKIIRTYGESDQEIRDAVGHELFLYYRKHDANWASLPIEEMLAELFREKDNNDLHGVPDSAHKVYEQFLLGELEGATVS